MQAFMLDLRGQKVVIAGGGRIAARKAYTLIDEKAEITFIAPEICQEIEDLIVHSGFNWVKRKALQSDFEGAFIVILATNDRKTNQELMKSLPPNQLVNVVDKLPLSEEEKMEKLEILLDERYLRDEVAREEALRCLKNYERNNTCIN
ncbi:NAD(P)-dependent oxidoreductase [Robertmurraya massiliosenegalensis]|uniref:NAD(P)-dependent oxidoreductase n=1 Tax=Robertmurraya TaxID=2837507 RepID=UPI0039A4D977